MNLVSMMLLNVIGSQNEETEEEGLLLEDGENLLLEDGEVILPE